MAFTTPRTWSVGEIPTAALFNEQIRDNVSDLDSRIATLVSAPQLVGQDTGEDSTTSTGAAGTLNSVTGLSIPASSGIRVILPFRKTTGAAAGVTSLSIELTPDGDVLGVTLTDTANAAGSGVIVAEWSPYDADYGFAAVARSYFRNSAGTNTSVNFATTAARSSSTITAVGAFGVVGSASITLYTQNMRVYELP